MASDGAVVSYAVFFVELDVHFGSFVVFGFFGSVDQQCGFFHDFVGVSTVVANFGDPSVLPSGEGVEFLFVDDLEVLPVACSSTEP